MLLNVNFLVFINCFFFVFSLRYVVCSTSEMEQNLVAFQQNGQILFRCCRSISPGHELRVWYSEEYAEGLGTIWDKIWDRKCTPPGNLA